jgi:hypothetical protein
MKLNFKEALAALARALPVVFFRAAFYVAGGLLVILIFGMTFFILRLAGGASPARATIVIALALLGGLATVWILQRFFLYRQQAALLFLFSGRQTAVPGLYGAAQEAGRQFPDLSSWMLMKRRVRQALELFYRRNGEFPAPPTASSGGFLTNAADLLASGMLGRAIISLAFARGGDDAGRSVREGLALYFRGGTETWRLARRWLCFSLAALALLFLCLATPNWFFFRGAGAPVGIGIVLAASIAWLLHQAFIVPIALAGVSAALLAETRGKDPEPSLCNKLTSLIPDRPLIDQGTG